MLSNNNHHDFTTLPYFACTGEHSGENLMKIGLILSAQ
jgi:hypothetical protein